MWSGERLTRKAANIQAELFMGCSQEIGNVSGSRYALQDKQEQSAYGDSW